MRRLTHLEYQSSISALFFPATVSSTNFDLPPDAISSSFDNNAEGINISDYLIEQYQNAAENVATEVFNNTAQRASVVGCDLASTSLAAASRDACLLAFVKRVGRMAYRRALSDEETAGLIALSKLPAANNDTDAYASAKIIARALLQSPNFIFRVEVGVETQKSGTYKLTGYEIATRLAYLLTTRGPDDELLAAAERGDLETTTGIETQAKRLLYATNDARTPVQQGIQNFYTQWLNLPKLYTVQRTGYSQWTPTLVGDLRTEVTTLTDDFVWNDGQSFPNVLTASYTYMNSALATYYGASGVSGNGFQKVNLEATSDRPGLLGRAGVISANTKSDETAVIFRGKFIGNSMLCQEVPAPDPKDAMSVGVDRLTTPKCAGCHIMMDKIGSGFAKFNAIGLPVSNAGSVNTSGTIQKLNAKPFNGIGELGQILSNESTVTQCIVTKLLTFGEGKQLKTDAPEVAGLSAAFDSANHDLRKLYLAYVLSDRFRYRVVNP